MNRVVERVVKGPLKKEGIDAADVRRWLKWLVKPTVEALRETERLEHFYLRQIVDSDMDADRLDWLRRDGLALTRTGKMPPVAGVGAGVDECVMAVLSAATCEVRQLTAIDRKVSPAVLRFKGTCEVGKRTVRTVHVLSGLLQYRVELYRDVYELPRKLAVDEMVAHGVRSWLDESGVEALREADTGRRGQWRRIRDSLARLTDAQLVDFILSAGLPHAARLVADAVGGRHFVRLGTLPKLDAGQVRAVLDVFRGEKVVLVTMVSTRQQEIWASEGNRRKLTVLEKGEVGHAWLKKTGLDKAPAKVWTLFLYLGSHDLSRKYELEQRVWKSLLTQKSFLKVWNIYLQQRFGIADEPDWTHGGVSDNLRTRPHVFVGLPFYTGRQVELLPREPGPDAAEIQGLRKPGTLDGEQPATPEKPIPVAHVYGPAEFAAATKLIHDTVLKAILDVPSWIVDEVEDVFPHNEEKEMEAPTGEPTQ